MQSRKQSLLEAVANTGSGFVVSLLVWMFVVTPLFGVQTAFAQDFAITCIFTITSIIRSYVWRRWFNRHEI